MTAQTATITITGVNDAPVVSAAVTSTVTEDDASFSLDLFTNASDVDATDILNVDGLTLDSGDNSGVTVNGNSLEIDPSAYDYLAVGDSAVIVYSYNVTDGEGGVTAQTATITITGVNDPPTVNDIFYNAVEDGGAVIGLFDGADVDSDDDGSSLTYVISPAYDGEGSVINNDDGTFSFDPGVDFQDLAAGETTTVTFTYIASDSHTANSISGTVEITVTGVNDAVDAINDTDTVTKDNTVDIDVQANDVDVDLDPLTILQLNGQTATIGNAITLASGATVTLQANGTVTYNPNGQFNDLVLPTDTDTDTFTYQITDGNSTTDTATVTVTITGSNELLVVTDELDDISRDGLTPETIDLDLHFNDPDAGDTVTYTVEAHVLGDNPGDALPADFWANVEIPVDSSDLNITYTDYSSEQVRLPLVITVTAESSDGVSDDVTSTFTLTPDPQGTFDIRLIAREVASSDRDFTAFRAETDISAILADGKGGARFYLTNGLQDLNYTIYLDDYGLDLDGTATPGDSTDDLKTVRIVDTTVSPTNPNFVLFTIFDSSLTDDNPTLDLSIDSLTGTWAAGEGLTSSIIDKLYNGDLAVQVVENTGGAGTTTKLAENNITVSPEVDDVSSLPSSVSQVVQGSEYVVEIWISDQLAQVLAGQTTETANLSSVILDMLWDVEDASLYYDVFTIYNSAFGFLADVEEVDTVGGALNNINATTVLPGLVTNGYGRVGYAVFYADNVTANGDPVDFTIDPTDLISGTDGVTRGGNIDFSQITITNTSVDQVATSEFFLQTDLSNLSVSGTITIDGQEINLLPQSTGLNSTSLSGRLDVVIDDVDNPGTIQIVDSSIEVNPSGQARPDRDDSGVYSATDLADFGLVGDQLIPDVFSTFDGEISLAIRDAIAQVLSSQQVIDGSGNFDISENWFLENGLLDSLIALKNTGPAGLDDTVVDFNSELTSGETMSFFDPLTGAPAGLAAWSQAKLTEVSSGVFELLIPISRRLEFTTVDGADVVLNLVGSATAYFTVGQEDTDEFGDTLATAEVTGLTSAAPGTEVYQGIIGNNSSIADPLLDVDMFQVQLDAGDSVIVDIDAYMFETGLDSIIRIFDSVGNEVAYSDDDLSPDEFATDLLNFPLDSYATFTATTTGTYYIGISAWNSSNDPATYDPTTTAGRPTGVSSSEVGSYDLTITVQDGALPLHGTQAIVTDTTLDEGTAVDLVVVRNQTELDSFGETSTLPTSDTWIDEWSSFWVEVYVETADARGITDAAVDLNYNTNFFTATDIEFSNAFAASGQAVIDDATGVVTGLSGTATFDKVGNGNKTLLARVKFESLAQDDVSIDFEDKFIGPHALGLSLSNVSVSLTNDAETTLVIGDAPDTDLWAIAYDVNDDDTINYRDLIILASIYGDNVLDTDSPYVWALDADKSGTVDYRDLNFMASNYGVHKGGDKDVVYPSNFLQRWYGKTTDISGDSTIDQVMDEALGIWQDALGLETVPDIQLVITNLGGTQLGEGKITGVDSEGRPVSGIVTLDDNAAGLGWYSDLDSSVFSDTDLQGGVAYSADAESAAAGHYDLLTVLLHEIGHVLGFTDTYAPFESFIQTGVGGTLTFVGSGFDATLTDDGLHLDDTVHAGDVMNATLDPGVRKLPSILDALILQSVHEAAASGSYEILVGVNAPLMANLPLVAEPPVTQVTENEDSLVTTVASLPELSPVVFDVTSSLLTGDEPVQSGLAQYFNQLLQSQGTEQGELDLTVLEGLSDEIINDLRLNGLSIVDSGKIDSSAQADLEISDLDLAGLNEEIDADFDDVFSDWAGPIL
ncbi:Ig-like domain-containing protein [Gimesia sp.]|uniref:Ig-like domain-containing protein n=1 Tax=Gimesia sp. TaxID=2024833 RepID=UPI003A947359